MCYVPAWGIVCCTVSGKLTQACQLMNKHVLRIYCKYTKELAFYFCGSLFAFVPVYKYNVVKQSGWLTLFTL